MSRVRIVALLTPLLLPSLSVAQPADFTSPDGKFSARFPGKPMETEQKTPAGPMKIYLAIQGTSGYAVMTLEAPFLGMATPEQIEMGLDKARTDTAGPGGKVLSETKIKLNDKFPGREWIIEKPKDGKTEFVRVRMYATDKDMLIVAVSGQTQEAVKAKEAVAFLDSFRTGKK
jgi:hypothetical protein